MAIGSLLTLLDDIATTLDDIVVMTQMTAKKTAGLLGDDLALNAEKVTGVAAERELPVVWAVTKGSLLNKLILVPAALLISYFIPWLITPLLMVGGLYLCFEGFEKVLHTLIYPSSKHNRNEAEIAADLAKPKITAENFEKEKVEGAIRTDFILSAEIIVVALGTVSTATFIEQIIVVSSIALLMTFGVYGAVAGIVKLDDVGLYLLKQKGTSIFIRIKRIIGQFLLKFAPFLMHALTVLGTIAMFLVGGGIITHGLPLLHHLSDKLTHQFQSIDIIGPLANAMTPLLYNGVIGIICGGVCYMIVRSIQKMLGHHITE